MNHGTARQVFDALPWAEKYAKKHQFIDPEISEAYLFPTDPPEPRIRLVYVNKDLPERADNVREPYQFEVDADGPDAHSVEIIDLTPRQWSEVVSGRISLPEGWDMKTKRKLP